MAFSGGLEPPTSGSANQRSVQLSYENTNGREVSAQEGTRHGRSHCPGARNRDRTGDPLRFRQLLSQTELPWQNWSTEEGSNLQPLTYQAGALPGCAISGWGLHSGLNAGALTRRALKALR